MRIAVLGSIVADTIEHLDGSVTESLGGIAHAVAALAALVGDEHVIVPLCRVGEDCRGRVQQWAAGLAGVSLEAVDFVAARNPHVRLSYGEATEEGERIERLSDPLPPLQPGDVAAAEDTDVVLVNCITGADCVPAAIAALRAAGRPIYLDVHSLALGHAADGTRVYRSRDDWDAWLGTADVAQCNRGEGATVCGIAAEGAREEEVVEALTARMRAARSGNADAPAGVCAMPPVWLLTLGAAGTVVLQRRAGEITRDDIAAPQVDAVDPTGAGDACGAGYVAAWMQGKTPLECARAAVRSGSAACTLPGAPDPIELRRALDRISKE